VLEANPRALAYYRKIGFDIDGHIKTHDGFGGATVMRLVRAGTPRVTDRHARTDGSACQK